jgi:hypothetical protein
MKRLFFLIAIAFLMTGCSDKDDENVDMASVGHYVWQNESDHRITLTVIGRFENEVLLPKEHISKTMIGFIFPPSPRSYTIEGMKISFDDGPYGGVFSIPTEYPIAPYNPCDEYNYEMGEEYKESGMLQRQWTYTFTNADYDAAVARGPMKEQYNHTGATCLQARNPAGEYFPAGFLQETLPKPFAFSKNIPTFVVNRLTGPDYEKIIVSADIAAARYPHDGL